MTQCIISLDFYDAVRYIPIMREAAEAVGRPRSIRRYGNRKLYDLEAARYVTLDDIAALVKAGHDVEVVDQRTGEDLTSFTLAQVLLEGLKQGASRIPRQVLMRLIRLAAGPASAWESWPEPRDLAARARQEAERIVSRLLGQGRLTLDEAVELRRDLGHLVHARVAEAQAGVESRLRPLLRPRSGVAGRSLEALRGRLQAFETYLEAPAHPRARRPGRDRAPRRKP
jgi:polyhydroxyalkanoate synthesis repressor PhaR